MLALTPNPDTQKRLALSWGVRTAIVPKAETTDDMVNIVDSLMKDTGRTVDGDLVVIVSGTPIGIPGTTNSIVVHKVGQVRK